MTAFILASLAVFCGFIGLALLEGYLTGKRMAAEAVESQESLR